MNILMVCLGNICRSPLAEGILRDKINQRNLDWKVDSAGTGHYHIGEAPHPLSQKVAKKHGVDISNLQARQFIKQDIELFDKIYVMDRNNYDDIRSICRSYWKEEKVDFLLNEIYPQENREVPDPWYGTEVNFHEVYAMLDLACSAVVNRYTSPHFNQLKK